jgi:hypothetical protein
VIGILASDNIADLKPLGDRLLVEVRGFFPLRTSCCHFAWEGMLTGHLCNACAQIEEGKDETEGGLLLTSSSKEQPTIGKVAR